jgi:carboxyl-terminal processing protease
MSLSCLLMLAGLAVAGPAPDGPPTERLQRKDAEAYAIEIVRITRAIHELYVRPVPVPELCAQALTALYQAAEIAAPPHLQADFEKADEAEQIKLIVRCRESVGNPAILRSQGDLLVSCRTICRCLDPYSVVLTGTDLSRGIGREMNSGVGLEVHDNGGFGPVSLRTIAPGGPAQRAGLRPGDTITHVDGLSLAQAKKSSDEIMRRLNSTVQDEILQATLPTASPPREDEPAGPVRLTLRRPGEKAPLEVKLEGEVFQPESVLGVSRDWNNRWNYWIDRDHKIAQIRLGALSPSTPDELAQVLEKLRQDDVRGVVLDLRWCPGGMLQSAIDVAGQFLRKGTIATIQGRKDGETKYCVEEGPKFLGVPVVVLVNADSSGGAELIAAALQDHGRATVAGQRTVGKGSVQSFITLPIQGTPAGLKLTSATFVRPSGKPLHRFPDSKVTDDWGVRPDPGQECRISPELSRQLRDWWLLQTLRPGGCEKTLPLDDPEKDVQCRQAVLLLTRRIR